MQRGFWTNQPVILNEHEADLHPQGTVSTQIDPKDHKKILPDGLFWKNMDVNNTQDLDSIYSLLSENYVDDELGLFRFEYSAEFIKWALTKPGWNQNYHIGIYSTEPNQLIGFIAATPIELTFFSQTLKVLEANFLCVSKRFRKIGLAPILIEEIIRQGHLAGIIHAIYTSGTPIHYPVSTSVYYQRYLNPIKLEKNGFVSFDRTLGPRFIERLYSVPVDFFSYKLRPIKSNDLPYITDLINNFLKKFKIFQNFSLEDSESLFIYKKNIIYSFVIENQQEITDFFSFYIVHIKSTRDTSKKIKSAYCFYYATVDNLENLFRNMVAAAKYIGADLISILNIMDNSQILNELKFEKASGFLHYFMYNFNHKPISPSEIGKILV